MKAIRLMILLLFLGGGMNMHAQTETDTCLHMHEIVVTGLTGTTHINHIPSPVSVVAHDELQGTPSTNIIDAIAKQPGVSQVTTGGGISKPVIRGLGYNRVLTVSDGLRQEGQQWGDEHGVEVDGESVHSVEVMKGPASLMYGSDAMAGVVIFHDAPILPSGTMRANVNGGWQSNANLWNYSVDFAGNEKGFVWDGRWSQKRAGEYQTGRSSESHDAGINGRVVTDEGKANKHNGTVENSQFSEQAAKLMMGFNKQWGFSHLKLSYYHLKPGIVGEHHHHEHESEAEEHEHESPFQQIYHYKAILDNSLRLGDGQLKLLVGYQQNRRKEYESVDEIGLDLRLHTINYDARYVSPQWSGWTMNAGIGGMWQRSENLGEEFLIPSYHLFDIGAFVTFARDFNEELHLSGGLRLDNRHLNSHELMDGGEQRFRQFTRNFTGLTGSIGLIYNATDHLDLRANIARGFRAPNLSELGSNGIHHGTTRYELGNRDLSPEFSWQFDLGADYSSEVLSAKLALFLNRINNYIFMEKTGEMVDDHDVFSYHQGDARLMGFEATVIVHPIAHLHFENSFSYVDARQISSGITPLTSENKYLPFTPAPRWLSSLHYHVPLRSQTIRNFFAEVEMDCNLAQNHVHTAYDTETRTPSYTLWNASVGTDFYVRRGGEYRRLLMLTLFAQNIFDRAYVNHLSRLKEADIYNMGRNIGVKVSLTI